MPSIHPRSKLLHAHSPEHCEHYTYRRERAPREQAATALWKVHMDRERQSRRKGEREREVNFGYVLQRETCSLSSSSSLLSSLDAVLSRGFHTYAVCLSSSSRSTTSSESIDVCWFFFHLPPPPPPPFFYFIFVSHFLPKLPSDSRTYIFIYAHVRMWYVRAP